jgi:hypothetical protein
MLSLWVVAKLVYLLYNHFSKNFKALPNETLKTNVVMCQSPASPETPNFRIRQADGRR